jgi:predicted HicB family RNase H-like nuclease
MPRTTATLNLRMAPEVVQALFTRAEVEETSVTALAERVLRDYLNVEVGK